MWGRQVEGRTLTFHLAGINNQNFLMRDEQTGSYWQQVSGQAISGPMKGKSLELVHSDELTFDLWKSEHPDGSILSPVTVNMPDYAKADWEQGLAKLPTVIGFANSPLPNRELVVGVSLHGADRAYPVQAIQKEATVIDQLGETPVLIVTGPDGKSIRAFVRRMDGASLEFFRKTGEPWALIDSATSSEWNFQGCAVSGPASGECLQALDLLKDYWFDWRQYHPATTVYRR